MEGLRTAVADLRDVVARARFPLRLPSSQPAGHAARAMLDQLDDYLLPRLARLDAPLLVVVGGSTGAGKSTLVNSLIQQPVSPTGVLRPTTRGPVLICHPDDAGWFTAAHVLPHLMRTRDARGDASSLRVAPSDRLTPGLALLDAPDIDSVVEANRALAEQLLAAGDLWLFVTTAARYADAVPWDFLRTARVRGTAVALVLDRVPAGAAGTVGSHLAEMLGQHGLGAAPLFVVEELATTSDGLLPAAAVAPVGEWLHSLARSAAARAAVVRQTVDGAIGALDASTLELAGAATAQVEAAEALAASVAQAYQAARSTVEHGVRDGTLLRGEVLARWQELVGTGEFMRALQTRIGRWRDRLVATVTGRPGPVGRLQGALESGLVTLVRGAAADAAEQTAAAWRGHPAGAGLLDAEPALGRARDDLTERIQRHVRDWQRDVLELVRTEAGNKAFVARLGAYAVNGLGLVVMIAVFTATAFIPTGAEIVVAGGTTIAAQKVLEAIFGDQAVRELAAIARQRLIAMVDGLLDEEAHRFRAVLAGPGIDPDAPAALRSAADAVRRARVAARLLDPPATGPVGSTVHRSDGRR
ncbi:MAG: dynamin family protein [Micromonosporaceae bacterium]